MKREEFIHRTIKAYGPSVGAEVSKHCQGDDIDGLEQSRIVLRAIAALSPKSTPAQPAKFGSWSVRARPAPEPGVP